MQGSVNPETGMFESMKESLHPSAIMKKLNLTKSKLLEMGIYLGVGFLAGYLLKKYGKFVIALIIGILALALLEQLGIISIQFHADKFQELFGIKPVASSEGGIVMVYWEWVKANVVLVLSFSIGFLIGLRVG
jgi:uncharacterized membrane protein (Fun14 family)